ncbi:sulfotransferase domain-containing protein [bacterium]|nr:sulfotransferase domain-containing protein [bacterium]
MLEQIENRARTLIKSSKLKVALGRIAYCVLPNRGRIALASFPRSGNTWMRVLLESASGQLTGSIYANDGIHSRGPDGLVIKTHSKDSFRYEKAIVLVRNPFDSIDSYFALQKNYFNNQALSWEEHVFAAVKELKEHHVHWKSARCETLNLKFETLKETPHAVLKEVFQMLELEVADDKIEKAISNSTISKIKNDSPEKGQAVVRTGLVGKGITSFDEQQQKYVRSELQEFIKDYDYQK